MSAAAGRELVRVEGELVVQTAADRRPDLLAELERHDALDLDLSGVSEFDTAGLQLLVLLAAEARAVGKQLRLISPSAAVLGPLRLIRLEAELGVVNREEAQ